MPGNLPNAMGITRRLLISPETLNNISEIPYSWIISRHRGYPWPF